MSRQHLWSTRMHCLNLPYAPFWDGSATLLFWFVFLFLLFCISFSTILVCLSDCLSGFLKQVYLCNIPGCHESLSVDQGTQRFASQVLGSQVCATIASILLYYSYSYLLFVLLISRLLRVYKQLGNSGTQIANETTKNPRGAR